MESAPVPPEVLRELGQFSTPTICNAIETLGLRSPLTGYVGSAVRGTFEELPACVGFAVTGVARLQTPDRAFDSTPYVLLAEHVWSRSPGPLIVVIQDNSAPPGQVAVVGDVFCFAFQRAGAVGFLTNGCVRDTAELRPFGFQVWARGLAVSHANVQVGDLGTGVAIEGLTIHEGDLLHGDRYGVVQVPIAKAEAVCAAARRVAERESHLIARIRAREFHPRDLRS